CKTACTGRCKAASLNDQCLRACGTCCARCNCVPPGTYGNKELCPCYASLPGIQNGLNIPASCSYKISSALMKWVTFGDDSLAAAFKGFKRPYVSIEQMYVEVAQAAESKSLGVFEDLKDRALDTLPNEGFSLQFLQDITSCFLDVDQNVAKLILENKKYIWKSPDLKEIIKEHFDNSLETLRFCEELENCLKRARSEQLKLQIALQHIAPQGSLPGKEQYAKIVEKLNAFKSALNPFNWDLFLKLDTLQTRHSQMLETLDAKRRQLQKKHWWIKC
ncbi:hypothetical protein KI387_035524, partial [Taxus chinensis]